MHGHSPFARRVFAPSRDGYVWVDAEVKNSASDAPYRAQALLGQIGKDASPIDEVAIDHRGLYDPMEAPTLHRQFAGTDPTRSGVMNFASYWGVLSAGRVQFMKPWQAPEDHRSAFVKPVWYAEELEFWKYQITKVKSLLRVCDALQSAFPREKMLDIVEGCPRLTNSALRGWSPQTSRDRPFQVIQLGDYDFNWLTISPYNLRQEYVHPWCDWTPDMPEQTGIDPLRTASSEELLRFVRTQVNDELGRHARPIVLREKKGISIVPSNLLGAIYGHVALEISGQGPRLARCPGCGDWFEQATVRKTRCGDACRVKVCRRNRRKRDALSTSADMSERQLTDNVS